MKRILKLLLLFAPGWIYSQEVDWASIIPDDNADLTFLSKSDDQIVWATNESEGFLFNKEKRIEVYNELDHSALISYSTSGDINWVYEFRAHVEIHGICHDPEGKLHVLLNHFRSPWGSAIFYDIGENEPSETGGYLLRFDKMGNLETHVFLDDLNHSEIEILDFKLTPKGQFVIAGTGEEGVISGEFPNKTVGEAGGEFVACIDTLGEIKWLNVISFRESSYIGGRIGANKIVVDKEGKIYMGGCYGKGAMFGDEITKLAPQSYGGKAGYETYLAAYHPNGKLDFVKTSENKGVFEAIAVGEKQVYLAYSTRAETSFGQKITANEKEQKMVVAFSKKGKVKWQHAAITANVCSMIVDENDQLFFAGEFDYSGQEDIDYYGVKLTLIDNVLITSVNTKGEVQRVVPFAVMIATDNSSLSILTDHEGALYCAGTIWCSMPYNLNIMDEVFPDVECYGGVNFLVKLK